MQQIALQQPHREHIHQAIGRLRDQQTADAAADDAGVCLAATHALDALCFSRCRRKLESIAGLVEIEGLLGQQLAGKRGQQRRSDPLYGCAQQRFGLRGRRQRGKPPHFLQRRDAIFCMELTVNSGLQLANGTANGLGKAETGDSALFQRPTELASFRRNADLQKIAAKEIEICQVRARVEIGFGRCGVSGLASEGGAGHLLPLAVEALLVATLDLLCERTRERVPLDEAVVADAAPLRAEVEREWLPTPIV